MTIWLAILLFVIAAVADGVWVLYTQSVTDKKAFKAASTGVFIYLLGAVGIVSYINDKWYMLPIGLGSWIGTFVTVKRS